MIADLNNPRCGCTVTSVVNPCPPSTPKSKCCLVLCNLLRDKDGFPCDDTITVDLTPYITIPTCCKDLPITYSIPYHTNNLKDVVINYVDSKYMLTYTSDYATGRDYKSAKITYQFSCGQLLNQADIVIPFKQINPLYNCSYKYDPCTGDCITEPGEIAIVSGGTSNFEVGIE